MSLSYWEGNTDVPKDKLYPYRFRETKPTISIPAPGTYFPEANSLFQQFQMTFEAEMWKHLAQYMKKGTHWVLEILLWQFGFETIPPSSASLTVDGSPASHFLKLGPPEGSFAASRLDESAHTRFTEAYNTDFLAIQPFEVIAEPDSVNGFSLDLEYNAVYGAFKKLGPGWRTTIFSQVCYRLTPRTFIPLLPWTNFCDPLPFPVRHTIRCHDGGHLVEPSAPPLTDDGSCFSSTGSCASLLYHGGLSQDSNSMSSCEEVFPP
jgi:hypothetical protein